MPSSKKEIPNARKRVTASARARTSVKKSKRIAASELDGSYVQRVNKTVSTGSVKDKQQPVPHSDNAAIFSILKDIKESNEALSKRMDRVERQAIRDMHMQSTIGEYHCQNSPQQPAQPADLGDQIRDHMAIHDFRHQYPQPTTLTGPHQSQGQFTRQHQSSQGMGHITHTRDNVGQLPDRRDAVIRSIQNLRGNTGISEAVNNLLASYEGNLYSELARGKPNVKKSGRYNTHDSVVAPPHLIPLVVRRGSYMMSLLYLSGLLVNFVIYTVCRTQSSSSRLSHKLSLQCRMLPPCPGRQSEQLGPPPCMSGL